MTDEARRLPLITHHIAVNANLTRPEYPTNTYTNDNPLAFDPGSTHHPSRPEEPTLYGTDVAFTLRTVLHALSSALWHSQTMDIHYLLVEHAYVCGRPGIEAQTWS